MVFMSLRKSLLLPALCLFESYDIFNNSNVFMTIIDFTLQTNISVAHFSLYFALSINPFFLFHLVHYKRKCVPQSGHENVFHLVISLFAHY